MKKTIRKLICTGLMSGMVLWGNSSEAHLHRGVHDVWLLPVAGDININIENNPNINNEVNIENNNENTNENTNTNQNVNKNKNTNKNKNKNKNQNTNTNENTNKNGDEGRRPRPEPGPGPRPNNKNHDPEGSFESAKSSKEGQLQITGWAYDQDDMTKYTRVAVCIGHTNYHSPDYIITANKNHASKGQHGFDDTRAVKKTGSQTVTLFALNEVGGGRTKQIGARQIQIGSDTPDVPDEPVVENAHDPVGDVETLRYDESTKKLVVKGWAYDEDNKNSPITVKVYVGGDRNSSNARAFDLIANQYHQTQGQHGFTGSLTLPNGVSGDQPVNVYAINLAGTGGSDKKIKTGTISIAPEIPAIDGKASLTLLGDQKVKIDGWTNTDRVRVKIENVVNDEITISNPNHERQNFEKVYQLPADFVNTHSYEVIAYNSSNTNNAKKIGWGNFTIPVPAHDPEGRVYSIEMTSPRNLRVRGEAYDKDDMNQNVKVQIWVGGTYLSEMASGPNHTFEKTMNLGSGLTGRQHVRVVALNTIGGGKDVTLQPEGDVDVQDPAHPPTGHFENLDGIETSRIRVRGWAKDEDAQNSPLRVHIYVGGGAGSGASSQEIRTDASGRFDATLSTNRDGWQDVYAYAIDNDGRAGNVEIGHGKVFIPWLGRASLRHDVYRMDENRQLYRSKDDRNTGWEKVFLNDPVVVLYEGNGYYLIRYHSDTDGYDKERWIEVNGGGIVHR